MNYEVYNAQMVRSAYDKLGFVDRVFDIDAIVDFGCADGAITEMIKMFYPNALVVGYDKYQKNTSTERIIYTQEWEEVMKLIEGKKAMLVMNSVVHEILNYEKEPMKFLNNLFTSGFEYIWIRDLCLSPFALENDFVNLANDLRKTHTEQVKDFEAIYGALAYPQNCLHFLAKVRYIENWKREVKENYTLFAIERRHILDMLEPNYRSEINEMYVLPYTRKINKEEFGIDLEICANTHYKGLFKLKKWN